MSISLGRIAASQYHRTMGVSVRIMTAAIADFTFRGLTGTLTEQSWEIRDAKYQNLKHRLVKEGPW